MTTAPTQSSKTQEAYKPRVTLDTFRYRTKAGVVIGAYYIPQRPAYKITDEEYDTQRVLLPKPLARLTPLVPQSVVMVGIAVFVMLITLLILKQ